MSYMYLFILFVLVFLRQINLIDWPQNKKELEGSLIYYLWSHNGVYFVDAVGLKVKKRGWVGHPVQLESVQPDQLGSLKESLAKL